MAGESAAIVQRLWNYCNVLRDDGMSYGDYVEQLTYLLFLKMDDEQVQLLGKPSAIPPEYGWQGLLGLHGDELESQYRHILAALGTGSGLTPVIFRKAQNRIQDPAKLRRLIELINGETTAGSHHPLDRDQLDHVTHHALRGWEIVDNTARLGVMNLHLHGIGANAETSPIHVGDSLASDPGERFSMVLTNPPFGKKSSVTYVNEEGETRRESLTVVRDDFWTSTSNKQLNFVQHVKTILAMHGRAAVVVPDNVLFEGGAGEIVRRKLLHECDVHTLLRLPTGIFYAQGVKANVLFFDRKPASETPWTKEVWIYDLRTNKTFTLKETPLVRADLDEFVACYKPENRHERVATWSEQTPNGRWRAYPYEQIMARDKASLDIFWLRDESLDDSATLPHPSILAAEIVEDLRAALAQFQEIADDLSSDEAAV